MSSHRFDTSHSGSEARRLLRERLQREEMGAEAYDRMVAQNDYRGFKAFGIAFIAVFGLIVLGLVWLGW